MFRIIIIEIFLLEKRKKLLTMGQGQHLLKAPKTDSGKSESKTKTNNLGVTQSLCK